MSINNTGFRVRSGSSQIITTPATEIPNTEPITNYDNIVYASPTSTAPNMSERTFIWTHLAGDLDGWAKQGLAGNRDRFRWNNEPLQSPVIPYPVPASINLVYNKALLNNIVSTLPREGIIWTPDWYTYPQGAINRYLPRAWNQFYFNKMATFATNSSSPSFPGDAAYSNIQSNQTFEISNTGGPVNNPGVDDLYTYFFYLATGSGIKMTTNRCLYSLNKLHALYVYHCWLLQGSRVENGLALELTDRVQAFINVFNALDATDLINATITSLINPAGYFVLPSTVLTDYLWDPITTDYPDTNFPTIAGGDSQLFALIAFNIGAIGGYTVSDGAYFNPPQPNIINNLCNATNLSQYSIFGINLSNMATKPYEYYAQVVTNLSVDDNILDPFVSTILNNSTLNIDAVVNLSQWNALGGWTCEIPCYYGSSSAGASPKPTITTTNRGTLNEQWWTGMGGILGINDYTSGGAKFTIASKYLS